MSAPLVIYIAGPYRAADAWRVNVNTHRAEVIANTVWEAGHYALCPHANTRYASSRVTDAQYLAGTMELMRRSDAVLVLPNWETSEGTCGEITTAEASGIPVAMLAGWAPAEVRRCIEVLQRKLAERAA